MRILFFTDTFVPKIDGIVTTICQTIVELRKLGHDVLVIAPEGGPEEFEGARVIGMRGRPFPLYPELKLCYPRASLRQVIVDFNPDLIHVVEPVLLGSAALYYAGGKFGGALALPLVTSYHTDLPKYLEHFKISFLNSVTWPILRIRHNRGSINLVTSHAMVEDLTKHGIERLRLWPGGVNLDRYSPDNGNAAMRHRLSDGHPDAPLLLFVGRVSAEKEIERIKPILEATPNARLAIVGDGPVLKEMRELYRHLPVHFAGFLRGQELAQAFASADLFVMPSRTETLGLVVLEAMCSGTPVIGANDGGIPEMIMHGVDGFLFDTEAESIQATHTLLNDADLRAQFAQRARTSAMQHGWSAATETLLEFYREAIATQRILAPDDPRRIDPNKSKVKSAMGRSVIATLRFLFR